MVPSTTSRRGTWPRAPNPRPWGRTFTGLPRSIRYIVEPGRRGTLQRAPNPRPWGRTFTGLPRSIRYIVEPGRRGHVATCPYQMTNQGGLDPENAHVRPGRGRPTCLLFRLPRRRPSGYRAATGGGPYVVILGPRLRLGPYYPAGSAGLSSPRPPDH